MCALQFAAQVEQKVIDSDNDQVDLEKRLEALDRFLTEELS